MRLGLYGGSFDPIHAGHVEPVRQAARQLALDRVVYLPTAYPPHKRDQELAPPRIRWLLCELALLDEPTFEVSPHELVDRPSYTVETLEHFRDQEPEAELFLVLGEDSFAALETWRRWRDLAELATLVVLNRSSRGAGEAPAAGPHVPADRVVHVPNPRVPFSSSGIRAALARGEDPPEGALAPRVLDYVRKYRLYR